MKCYRGRLFDHVHLVVANLESSRRFYGAANNPTKGLNTPAASQNNTRVLSAQATNIPNCIEIHKFPLAMARDLIGQQF